LHPQTLEKQYKQNLSDFNEWKESVNEETLVYPENFGKWMSIDETALHNGELYTVITNKEAHGKKGALAALIKGTKNEIVSKALNKVPIEKLMAVRGITADLANSMDWICRTNFMNATIIADRFHVQQIISEAVQSLRIKFRWKAMDNENEMILQCKKKKIKYKAKRYFNGDTEKQLLARSRYFLFMSSSKWISSQKERAKILFKKYPELEKAYNLSMMFRNIYENSKNKRTAKQLLKKWFKKVDSSNIREFLSAKKTIKNNIGKILNYFPDRQTNASAESFNAKIKGFRSLVRGVRDIKFFLFRIQTFYA
jgi:transposase